MRNALRLWLILSLLTLTSCASWKARNVAPEPPRIDCSERAPGEPLPARPKLAALPAAAMTDAWWRAYVRRLTGVLGAYERRLLGTVEADRTQRAETADCIDRERAAGRIR